MIWECGIVLAKVLDRLASGSVPPGSPLHAAFPGHPPRNGPTASSDPAAPLAGLRVVELGSGTGIGGLTAAALGAHVLLTDTAAVLPLLTTNCADNASEVHRAGGEASAHSFEWERPAELPQAAVMCDLVLAADVLYHPRGAQLETLAAALAALTAPSSERPGGARLLLVHKARHDELDDAMATTLRQHAGLVLTAVPRAHHHPDFRSPSIHVYVGVPNVASDAALDEATQQAPPAASRKRRSYYTTTCEPPRPSQ